MDRIVVVRVLPVRVCHPCGLPAWDPPVCGRLLPSAVCRLPTEPRAQFDQLQSGRGTAETARYENLIAGLRGGSQDRTAGRYLANEN